MGGCFEEMSYTGKERLGARTGHLLDETSVSTLTGRLYALEFGA